MQTRIDELLEKQRQKRIKERELYANGISSKKSKKSNKKGSSNQGDELQIIPPLPTLPIISNVNLYDNEKKSQPWMHQQPEHQNSNYVGNQPMTPLESTYSLQRNNTKYNPYNETPYISTQGGNYNQYQDLTNNYYYPSTQQRSQYNSNSNDYSLTNTAYNAGNAVITGKPHEYDDSYTASPSQISGDTSVYSQKNQQNKQRSEVTDFSHFAHTSNNIDSRSNTMTTIPSIKNCYDDLNILSQSKQSNIDSTRRDYHDSKNENLYQLQDYYHGQDLEAHGSNNQGINPPFDAKSTKDQDTSNQYKKYTNYI